MSKKRSRLIRRATSKIVESLESRMMLTATLLYWDPSQASPANGGSGTWDTTSTDMEWRSGNPTTGPLVAWNNSGDANGPFQAVFSAGTGQVSIAASVTAAQVTFSSSGYTVNSSSGSSLTLANGQQISVATGDTAAINAPIAGSAGLTKTGSGILILGGSNTYTNQTSVSAGTLQMAGSGTLGAASNSLTINGGTFDLHGVSQTVNGLISTKGVSSTVVSNSSSATLTISGSSSSVNYWGNLKDGSGQLSLVITSPAQYLSGTNSFSGGTTINARASLVAETPLGSGSVTDNGAFTYLPVIQGSNSFPNSIMGSGTVTISPNYPTGTTATLTGTNTYTGGTTITSAIALLTGSSELGSASGPLTIASNAALDLNGFSLTVGTLTDQGVIRDGTTSSTAAATFTVSNGGSITKGFQNSNGKLSIATSGAGTLSLPSALFIPTGYTMNVPWTIGSGTTLSGNNIGADSVADNGTLSLNEIGLNRFGALPTYSVSNVMSGTGNVVFSSNGIVGFSPSDTYTGTTTAQSGTLSIQQSNSSNLIIDSGASLAASATGGTVSGSITVQSGGTISPGSAGTSVLNAQSVTLASGSDYNAVINSSTPGSGYDQIGASASLNISGSVLNLSGVRPNHAGDQIVLINNSGGSSVVGTFSGLPEGSHVVLNGVTYLLTYHGGTGNEVLLTDVTQSSLIRLGGAGTVTPGEPYQLGFTVVGSSSNPSFTINWGDGSSPSQTSAGSTSASHTYSDPGNYSISVSAIINGVSCTSTSFGLDASFGQNGLSAATSTVSEIDGLVIQPSGTSVILDAADKLLEGFNSDGSVDTAFGSEGVVRLGLSSVAKTLTMDPSGNLYVAGMDGSNNLVVEHVTVTGLIDSSFGTSGEGIVLANAPNNTVSAGMSLLVDTVGTQGVASEQILLTFANYGSDETIPLTGSFEVVRLFSNGMLDQYAGSLGSGIFTGPPVALAYPANIHSALASDGNLLVVGNTSTGSVLEQFDSYGAADTAFNGGQAFVQSRSTTALGTSALGNIILGTVDNSGTAEISQFNSNGSTGASFGSNGVVQLAPGWMNNAGVTSVTQEGNGDLLVTGVDGGSVVAIEYQSDGSLDTTFGTSGVLSVALASSGTTGTPYPAFQSDGQIVVAASPPSGTTPAGVLVRVNSDNRIAVSQAMELVPYKLSAPIFSGTPVTLTAEGEGVPGLYGSLNWSEYRNGQLVESITALESDDGNSHSFATLNPGQYIVDAVSSDSGASASYSFTVLANPPTVSLSAPYSATVNSPIVLIADAAHDPAPPSSDNLDPSVQYGPGNVVGATFTYSWVVKYQSSYQLSGGSPVTYDLPAGTPLNLSSLYFQPTEGGLYIVTVAVISSDGGGAATATRTIAVGGSASSANTLQHVVTPVSGQDFSVATSEVVQPNGKIVVASWCFSDTTSTATIAVMRYNPDLTLDDSFGDGGIYVIPLNNFVYLQGYGIVTANVNPYDQSPVALQADGKIIVGAFDGTVGNNGFIGTSYSELFRLNANGSLDLSFGESGAVQTEFTQADVAADGDPETLLTTSGPLSLVELEDGNVVSAQVVQDRSQSPYPYYWILTQYNGSDGSLDTSFGNNGFAVADTYVAGNAGVPLAGASTLSVAVEPNGTFIVGGTLAAGLFDGGLGLDAWEWGIVTFDSNGNFINSGFGNTGGAAPGWIVTPGSDDTLFDLPELGLSKVTKTVINGVPYILVGGTYGTEHESSFVIAEYTLAGVLNQSFGGGTGIVTITPSGDVNELENLTVLPDGSILVVGDNSNRTAANLSVASTNVDIVTLTSAGAVSQEYVEPVSYAQDNNAIATAIYGLALDGGDWIMVGGAETDIDWTDEASDVAILSFQPDSQGAINLTATATAQGTINLNWASDGGAADSFGIERKTFDGSGDPYIYIGATTVGVTTYTDASVQPGMTYSYIVYALAPSGPEGYSQPANASTPAFNQGYEYLQTLVVPIDGTAVQTNFNLSAGIPYLLVATGNISQTADGTHRGDAEYGYYPSDGVSNWWLNNPYGGAANGYEYGIAIGQSPSDLDGFYTKTPYWGPLATDAEHTYSIIFTPQTAAALLANYHDIYYPDNRLNSGDIPLEVAIYQPLPPTPSFVVAQGDPTRRSIDLAWTLSTPSWASLLYNGSSSALVQRSSDGGRTFATIATIAASQLSWSDNSIAPNTPYVYRVIYEAGGVQSNPSNQATATLTVNGPQIKPILPQVALRNQSYGLQVLASDPQYPLGGLTYSLSAPNTPLTINASTGYISGWTPPDADGGNSYPVTVTVTNTAGVSSGLSFVISVPLGDSPIQITENPTATLSGGNRYALSIVATEPGVIPSDLFYTWSAQWNSDPGSQPPLPNFTPQGTTEASNAVATVWGAGYYTFTVTVTDSFGNTASASTSLVPVTPVLTSLSIAVRKPSLEIGGDFEGLLLEGSDQFGNDFTVTSPTWIFAGNSSYGSIDSNGVFTSGSTPGVVTIEAAASVGGGEVSTTASIDISGLTAPSGLSASDVDPNGFTLSWNASSGENFASYDVEDSLNPSGPFVTELNGTPLTNTSTSVSTIPGAAYYFEVVAEDANGVESPPSEFLQVVVPPEDTAVPPPPTDLTAKVAAVNYGGFSRVALNWDAVTGQHILGYDVYRSNVPNFVPGASNLIGSSIDNEYVDDSSLTSGSYYYLVETANDFGDSGPSNQATANLSAPVQPPQPPENVSANVLSVSSNQATVQVTWTDTSHNETEFQVNRSTGSSSGPWSLVGFVPTNVTSINDTPVSLGTAVYYQVIAINTAGTAASDVSSGLNGSNPVATSIQLTPQLSTIQTGGDDQITAQVVDQYGTPMQDQPSSFTWVLEPDGAGGNISSGGLYTAPQSLSDTDGVLENTDVIEASADGLTGQLTLQTVVPQAPIVAITSLGSGSTPTLLTQDTEIDGVVSDPAHGTLTYTLTATPVSGGGAITISTGDTSVGTAPDEGSKLGTLLVASLPGGLYEITLTATDQYNLTNHTEPIYVQVQSSLKLGNLILPFTDLTINSDGGNPVPVTRTYDSSQAGTDNGFGYGWTINVTNTDLRSTVAPQGGITYPGYEDGDLLYITTPDGVQHTFQFLANPTGDFVDSPFAGIVDQVETFTPQFLCVDGSGAQMMLANSDGGDDSSNFTLYQVNGRYEDESGTGFNPANSALHLHYVLKTADGTQYSVDPSTGQLSTATDVNGNTTDYSSGSLYSTTSNSNNQISSVTDNATGQTVYYFYGNDPSSDVTGNEYDLIGTQTSTGAITTYIYGDQLILPSGPASSVYAVITRTSDHDVWDATNGWVSSSTNDHLTLNPINGSGGITAWYNASVQPLADGTVIAPGTPVSIAYYVGINQSTPTLVNTESRTWSAPHLLTGIIDSDGVSVLAATYNGATGQLTALVNAMNQSSGVNTGGFNGTTGDQTVTDAAGNTTEDIYDQFGDVIREIQTQTSNGAVVGYIVTVSSYSYFNSQAAQENYDGDFAQAGVSLLNDPTGQVTYAPFEINGTDPYGSRYSEQPPTPPQQIITYYQWNGDPNSLANHPEYGKVETEMTLAGPGSTYGDWNYNVTTYSGYSLSSFGKPTTTFQQMGEYSVDSSGNTSLVQTIGPSSGTSSTYDSDGNLQSSNDSTGVVTKYTYTNNSTGVPNGLLLDTYRSSSANSSGWVLTASNSYYGSTNISIGAVAGLLASSTTYNNEYQGGTLTSLSQTSYDVYDAQGNVLMSYTPKSWTTNSGAAESGWSAQITQYDLDGRSVSTFQATYLDSGDHTLHFTIASNSSNTGVVTVTNAIYSDATQSSGGSLLQTGATKYTPDGQTSTTTDQYGDVTTNTYDAAGHLVQTLYPDGTEVRSVYDALGRVTWQTDRATVATLNSGANATQTIYNSIGQVSATNRSTGTVITLAADPNAPTGSTLEESSISNQGTPISTTTTIYNAAGQVVETDSPTGLRTGTIYYADGSVEYTGPLNPTAASTWYLSANPTGSFSSHSTNLYNQVDASSGNLWSGLTFNETVDANGNATKSFSDTIGDATDQVSSVSITVYADGSFTQTIGSIGDQPITFDPSTNHLLPTGLSTPSGLTIPQGGSETINIAQRKSSDSVQATFDVYDAAGNLVDVYEPPVADALNSNTMTEPHTHYDYDANGNEIKQTDAKGNVTIWMYDENGSELSRTLPYGEKEYYTYNQFGQVNTHTDFDQNVATYTYYSNYSTGSYTGSVEQVVYTPGAGAASGTTSQTVSYTYDSLGRQKTTNDASGVTTNYYDGQGNLNEQQTPEGTIWYVFNQSTGQHTETFTNDTDTVYGYNTLGELNTMTVRNLSGTALTTPLTTTYTYDAAGNKLTETLPDGEQTQFGYDNLNRLVSMNESQGTTTLFSETFILNDDGTRHSASESQLQSDNSTTITLNYSWGYDADDRLLSESLTSSNTTLNYSDTYSYDLDGNQIQKVHTTSAGTETTTNTYNGDNELTQSVDSSTGTTTYGYDANGSQTSSTNGGNVTTYTYDVRNRLASVTTGGVTTTYGYDDAGNRVSETTGGTQGGTTYYLIDSNNPTGYAKPVEQWTSTTGNRSTATLSMSYCLGDRVLAQVNGSGVVSYLLIDGQENTRALTNSSGVVTATFNYSAFGDVLGATYTLSSPPPTIFLFQQMMFDTASGLNFTESRQTPMGSAYWIERDPDGYSDQSNPITLNATLFDNANPLMFTDPTGHDGLADLLTTLGIGEETDSEGDAADVKAQRDSENAIEDLTNKELAQAGENLWMMRLKQEGFFPINLQSSPVGSHGIDLVALGLPKSQGGKLTIVIGEVKATTRYGITSLLGYAQDQALGWVRQLSQPWIDRYIGQVINGISEYLIDAFAPGSQAAMLLNEAKGALVGADIYLLRAKFAGLTWDTQGFDIAQLGGGKVKASGQQNISELDSVESYPNTPDLYEAP